VVTFRASVFRAFRAAALIASVAVEDLAVIASAAAVDLEAVALAVLADSVVADLGAGDENKCSEFPDFISRKAQTTN
jgi:hypothetical protein